MESETETALAKSALETFKSTYLGVVGGLVASGLGGIRDTIVGDAVILVFIVILFFLAVVLGTVRHQLY